MDAPVVAVLSLKGGVGKTTVTLGLASAAMQEGRRVLVVDLDPQGNATAGLNLSDVPTFTTSDVLYDGRTGVALDAVVATGWGPLIDAIAAERALEHRAVPSGADPVRRLQRALRGAADRYDLILLDCPPSLGNSPATRSSRPTRRSWSPSRRTSRCRARNRRSKPSKWHGERAMSGCTS